MLAVGLWTADAEFLAGGYEAERGLWVESYVNSATLCSLSTTAETCPVTNTHKGMCCAKLIRQGITQTKNYVCVPADIHNQQFTVSSQLLSLQCNFAASVPARTACTSDS